MIDVEFIDDVYKQSFIEFVDDINVKPDTEIIIESDMDDKFPYISSKDILGKWMLAHEWNPNNKSVVVDGKSIPLANIDEEKYRGANEFLKRHKFNPTEETIQMYYKHKRLKCDMSRLGPGAVAAVSINARKYALSINKDDIVKGFPDSQKLYLPINNLINYGKNQKYLEATFQHECVHHEIQCGVEAMWKDIRKKLKKYINSHYKDQKDEYCKFLEEFVQYWAFIPYIDKHEELKKELDSLFEEYIKLTERQAKIESDTTSSRLGKLTDKISAKIMEHMLKKKTHKAMLNDVYEVMGAGGYISRFADTDFIKNDVKSKDIRNAANISEEYVKAIKQASRDILKKTGSNIEEMVADSVGLQRAEKILKEQIDALEVVGYSAHHAVNAEINKPDDPYRKCMDKFTKGIALVEANQSKKNEKYQEGITKIKEAYNTMKKMCETERKIVRKYALLNMAKKISIILSNTVQDLIKLHYHTGRFELYLTAYKKIDSAMKALNIDRK